MKEALLKLREQIANELENDILPFWVALADKAHGGFYGNVTNDLKIDRMAEKGCVLNSRILWTFSKAFEMYGKKEYREAAEHAYSFLKRAFWDYGNSGLYWMVDFCGNPINKRKHIYNIAFGIYALSEYHKVFNDHDSLNMAITLYNLVEKYSYEPEYGGYIDAFTEDWKPVADMRLSPADLNAPKTMNTHLHLLEAYANLYRVWKNSELKKKLNDLITLFIEKIIDPKTFHLKLFFTEKWESMSDIVSYGHDIECSWLLCEAADVAADSELRVMARNIAVSIADKVIEEGYDKVFGGLYDHADSTGKSFRKEWWPQAEMIVGMMNALEITGNDRYITPLTKTWEFIYMNIIDHRYGEWFHTVERNGRTVENIPKVEQWKCPYHNARACMEFIQRCDRMLK
ncbi:AGE family epimerase/isomerase [Thermoclostridium stercorarium]|uniref:AGE family epimerase/isomerase n=1 Tax=Thermoclostridium stercorarium TaxID=1510 RepID=UPI0022498A4B|nr:AGE family epimerase/isomerase [Thermoclostridium stercorarium]UZQ84452.1 AGE family epimerase/isomerase [Thermoclostridium stercorarium]